MNYSILFTLDRDFQSILRDDRDRGYKPVPCPGVLGRMSTLS